MPCLAVPAVAGCPGPPAAGMVYPLAPGVNICPTCRGKAYIRDRRASIAGMAAANASAAELQVGWTRRALAIVEQLYTEQFGAAGPPTNYAFCITGSGARQEACPFSDLDAFIVTPDPTPAGQLAQWAVHSQAVMNRMDAINADPANPLGAGKGFVFCNGGLNPLGRAVILPGVQVAQLTDTAHNLAGILENYFSDPNSVVNQARGHVVSGLMESAFGFGEPNLHQDLKREVDLIMGQTPWKMASRPHLTRSKRLGMKTIEEAATNADFDPPAAGATRVNIKKQFYRVPQFVLKGLAWYYDIDAVASHDQINQLQARGRLHATKAQLFRQSLDSPLRLRVVSHLAANAESDYVRTHNDATANPDGEYQMTLAETNALLGELPHIAQIRTCAIRFVRQKRKLIGKRTNPFAS